MALFHSTWHIVLYRCTALDGGRLHLMTSLPEMKCTSGFDSMPTRYPIKNLPYMSKTQSGSARWDGCSRRDICLSAQKRSSLSWKERVPDLPCLHWPITLGKCWKALFMLRNCKRWPKTDNVHRVEKILKRTKNRVLAQWRGYSTIGWMWKISCDLSCDRSVAFHDWYPTNLSSWWKRWKRCPLGMITCLWKKI